MDVNTQIFDPVSFERYCSNLRIDTKEMGRVPLKFLGTQRYVVEQIAQGLNNDIHTFTVLKGRQLGISSVFLAFDSYWLSKNPGLQGACVTDTDENRSIFRSYLVQYMESLPPRLRPPILQHNRVQLVFDKPVDSRLVYMVAGTKKKGDLGRAKSVNFLHATECSSWGDEEGFNSLMNTLAQKNPKRVYIFESTARGYNMFYQAWEVAKESKTQMAIFVGWWRNEFYAWPRDSVEFKTFWDGEPTSDERVWIGEVFEKYQVEITPEQIAWWRWYVREQMKGDEMMALQEMPPTEDYAFQLSGSKFFEAERVNKYFQIAIKQEHLHYRYEFGLNFEDTRFIETNEENAEVLIWETPTPGATYVLGADPAYGSSEWADEFAGCGGRCFADKFVQVYEIGSTTWTEQQFAWVLAHMGGFYEGTMLSLEMQGPGSTVFNELRNLRDRASTIPHNDPRLGAFDVVGRIRDYLWRRQDSMSGTLSYQWQTIPKEKVRMMSTLRSYFQREGMLEINSPYCLQQFRNIHRQGDSIGGEGRAKDDRVIALAIAVIAWNDWILQELMARHETYDRVMRPKETARANTPVENSVINYLARNGIRLRGLNR